MVPSTACWSRLPAAAAFRSSNTDIATATSPPGSTDLDTTPPRRSSLDDIGLRGNSGRWVIVRVRRLAILDLWAAAATPLDLVDGYTIGGARSLRVWARAFGSCWTDASSIITSGQLKCKLPVSGELKKPFSVARWWGSWTMELAIQGGGMDSRCEPKVDAGGRFMSPGRCQRDVGEPESHRAERSRTCLTPPRTSVCLKRTMTAAPRTTARRPPLGRMTTV